MADTTLQPGCARTNPNLHTIHEQAPTRRNIMTALAGGVVGLTSTAIALSAAQAAPSASPADLAPVEAAWTEWKRCRAAYNAQPDGVDDESPLDRADELEDIIRVAKGASPRVAEIKLWVALSSMVHYSGSDAALHSEDFAHFDAHSEEMDWHTQMVIGAIGTLRSKGA